MYSPVTGLWRNGLWLEEVQTCGVEDLATEYKWERKQMRIRKLALRCQEFPKDALESAQTALLERGSASFVVGCCPEY